MNTIFVSVVPAFAGLGGMSSFETQGYDPLAPGARRLMASSSADAASAMLHAFWTRASEAALAIADDGTITEVNPAAQALLSGFGRVVGGHLGQVLERADRGTAAPRSAAGWVAALQSDGDTAGARWVLRDGTGRVAFRPSAVELKQNR